MSRLGICLMMGMVLTLNCLGQGDNLSSKIRAITAAHPSVTGVAILDLQNGKSFSLNGRKHLPMHSVYKFHLALTVLNQVDQGKLSLKQLVPIEKKDLDPETWSPLREKYPEGGVEIPLSELLTYTVALSDNNGCDILFKLIGGAAKADSYIRSLGIREISIAATEKEMKMYGPAQYTNWTTPLAACQLLKLFDKNTFLSASSHDFLWKVMTETTRGATKIKGQLPAGTPVAHKTGYSGVNKDGITTATNDIGIVTLPDGRRFAIAVFVTMTRADERINEAVIAAIAKAGWDYFLVNK